MLEEDRPHSYVYASYDFENGSDPAQVIHRLTHQLEKNGLVFPLSAAAELTFNEKSGIPVYEEIKEKDETIKKIQKTNINENNLPEIEKARLENENSLINALRSFY